MGLRRSSHNIYDTQYHLVWAPKYRKKILAGAVKERMRELLFEIAESYRIEIEELTLRGRVVVGCCEREIRELKS